MKKILAVFLSVLFVVSAAGCSSLEGTSSAASSSGEASGEASRSSYSATAPESGTVSDSDSVFPDTSSGTSANSDADTYALPASSAAPESSSVSSAQSQAQQTRVTDTSSSPVSSKVDLEPDSYSGSSVSQEEYDKIQNGMTYEQVEELTGGSGRLRSEFGTKGTSFYTAVYRWKGYGSADAYADLSFQGGKLNMKIQFGLK